MSKSKGKDPTFFKILLLLHVIGLLIIVPAVFLPNIMDFLSIEAIRIPILFASAIVFLIWLSALISLLGDREMDVHDKFIWFSVILQLSLPGAIAWFILAPNKHDAVDAKTN